MNFNLPSAFKKKNLVLFLSLFILVDCILVLVYLFKTSKITPSLFKKKPGSCLILEEKFCRSGKPIYKEGKLIFIGFKVPKDTVIFTPFDGKFSNSRTFFIKKGDEYKTFAGYVVDEDGKVEEAKSFSMLYYNLQIKDNEIINRQVKKGEEIGKISEKILSEYGDYNFLVSFSKFSSSKKMQEVDQELLKEVFKL